MENLYETLVALENLIISDENDVVLPKNEQKYLKSYLKSFTDLLSIEDERKDNILTFEVGCLQDLLERCKGKANFKEFSSNEVPITQIFNHTGKYKLSIVLIELTEDCFKDFNNKLSNLNFPMPPKFFFGIRQNNNLKTNYKVKIIGA